VRFTVTTPACPLSSYIEDEIRACLWQLPGLDEIDVACEYEPAWQPEDMSDAARDALGWAA
jgi:metal-sulfur cluster biosynthetic enzyme